jgi:hypothetical protein
VVTFGRASDADVRAETVTVDRDGRASFELRRGDERARPVGDPGSTWCRTPRRAPSARNSTCRSETAAAVLAEARITVADADERHTGGSAS